jgi:hypothetical protein
MAWGSAFPISYLRAGGSAFALLKLLGHTTLHTTLTDVAMTSDDLVAEHRQHSPVDAMLGNCNGVGPGRDYTQRTRFTSPRLLCHTSACPG